MTRPPHISRILATATASSIANGCLVGGGIAGAYVDGGIGDDVLVGSLVGLVIGLVVGIVVGIVVGNLVGSLVGGLVGALVGLVGPVGLVGLVGGSAVGDVYIVVVSLVVGFVVGLVVGAVGALGASIRRALNGRVFGADVRRARKDRQGRTGWCVGGGRRPESGGVGDAPWLAWLSAERLAEYLLARAVGRLPEGFRERYDEEWFEHRTHRSGWRLLWWALCVRATAARTGRELRDARLPRLDR